MAGSTSNCKQTRLCAGDRSAEQGFSLFELMVASGIMMVILASAHGVFSAQLRAGRESDLRWEGAQAAQTIIDDLRDNPIASMPTSGSDAARDVTVKNNRQYSVVVTYCQNAGYCSGNAVRHVTAVVQFNGATVYRTEAVFTDFGGTGIGSSSSSSSSSSSGSPGNCRWWSC